MPALPLRRLDDSTIIVVPHHGTRGAARFRTLFETRRLLQVDFDVVPRARDVPNNAREREPPQVVTAEARELTDMRVDVRRSNVARIFAENRTELTGELLFELLFRTGWSHLPSVVRECRYGRIERLRVEALSLVRHPGEARGGPGWPV